MWTTASAEHMRTAVILYKVSLPWIPVIVKETFVKLRNQYEKARIL